MSYSWSSAPFARLYEAIQANELDVQTQLLNYLNNDLNNLILHKNKNETSRKKLESGKVVFQDGMEYELNQEFILAAIKTSDELNLDELASAEILYYASSNELQQVGTTLIDSAKAAYSTRRQFILQIVAYYLCTSSNTSIIDSLTKSDKYFEDVLLASFKFIESDLESIGQLVERSRLLDTHRDPSFLKSISYRRDMLFKEHQLLGEVFYGLIIQKAISFDQFSKLINHISDFQADDMFIMGYIPGIFKYFSSLDTMTDSNVKAIHSHLMKETSNTDKLSDHPILTLIILVFLTSFIDWCKKDKQRTAEYEFIENVDEPMRKIISLGALEQLLSLVADTSLVSTTIDSRVQPMYDFRPFLQQHIPRLIPTRMLDIDEVATGELRRTLQQQSLALNTKIDEKDYEKIYVRSKDISFESHFTEFCASIFDKFVHQFIKNSAFILTYLRDAEEDQLLSSEDFDLDVLAENADLERFYLSMFYLYSSRPELATQFWSDKNSSSYGFLKWASRCNSPLIISTFCLVLSALSNSNENAINTFNFLQLTNSETNEIENSTISTSSLINKYSCVSWSTIYTSLSYYNKELSDNSSIKKNNPMGTPFQLPNLEENAVVELGEDSIIFISGFFQLISEVARNSSRARSELLQSDDYQLLSILTDFSKNSTPLIGPTLTVLSSLVNDNVNDRKRFWQLIDSWIFSSRPGNNVVPKDLFTLSLKSTKEIAGFSNLITELLRPIKQNNLTAIEAPYPLDLGSRFHKQGIWPYIEFLSTDVFVNSSSPHIPEDERISLQLSILTMWENCLAELDPNFVLNAAACSLKDLDNISANRNIIQLLQSSPSSASINFLYHSNVYNNLFDIASLGIDTINELQADSKKMVLVEKSLKVIELLLERETFYIDELLPILRLEDNPFYPSYNIGVSGMGSFYNAFLLRLPFVAHISLYIGSTNLKLARTSLSILKKIAVAHEFNSFESSYDHTLLNRNRLLTLFETIDESTRIRYAFIDQFNAPIEGPQSITIKVELLQFLNNNLVLNASQSQTSISHFLLGFNGKNMSLGSQSEQGTILSDRSMLNSMLKVLKDTLSSLSRSSNIDYAPIRICSLSLEIILKLCKSNVCGTALLSYLRDGSNFFLELLNSAKTVSLDTYWSGQKFKEELCSKNTFTSSGDAMCALTAFIMYRSLMLQLIALELHHTSATGSRSLTKKYIEILTDSGDISNGSRRILEFLDVLEYRPKNMIEKVDQLFSMFNFEYIFKRITLKSEPIKDGQEIPYDMSVIDDLIGLFGKESQTLGLLKASESEENSKFFEIEASKLKKILTNSISFDNFKAHHLQCLHSWVSMVQVIVTDGHMNSMSRSNFILEMFQSIVPKITDYLEFDISYAEDLISLCVSLYHVYEKDKSIMIKTESEREISALLDSTRLFPLFKACIIGIMSPQATPSVRSDLYVLTNNYLQHAIANRAAVTDIMIFIRSADQRLIQTVCNDSLIGDGPCRITALLLLESLIKVISSLQNSKNSGNFIIDMICKNNFLLLLVQKLKSTDDLFTICLEGGKQGITLDALLYELTTFKTCIYFLIRVAQTRSGAQQLLHGNIFNVIKDCRFLLVDADLGFTLNLEEHINGQQGEEKYIELKLSLDSPLSLKNGRSLDSKTVATTPLAESISYYEIFVPVFQLVATIVISLGAQNETSVKETRSLMKHFEKLITAVLKRDIILEEQLKGSGEHVLEDGTDDSFAGLRSLVKLVTLIDSLV
ncbi:hypothetical protein CANARDRAFT_9823 [[Candida] arabinofermentans NRRL YB-2248]|uniref:Nucleoporin n=1 Tax=[Candida] arabinofermentans NRRL YB-2248 TaxID=983967 RepID=A0A1E4SUT8_9ASCO|nr:hypothetical protein CANARDRAFT_9823 [[Candida] arabinofermentans NRRL YB-2248]